MKVLATTADNAHNVQNAGSLLSSLDSVLKNRKLVQTVLIDLRDETFEFEGNELLFTWNLQWCGKQSSTWQRFTDKFHWRKQTMAFLAKISST